MKRQLNLNRYICVVLAFIIGFSAILSLPFYVYAAMDFIPLTWAEVAGQLAEMSDGDTLDISNLPTVGGEIAIPAPLTGGAITIRGATTTVFTSTYITSAGDIRLIIENLNITPPTNLSGISLANNSSLILSGTNKITLVSGTTSPGIDVASTKALTIDSINSGSEEGQLTISGSTNAAYIGGVGGVGGATAGSFGTAGGSCGTIIINGGTIIATGGVIGGGLGGNGATASIAGVMGGAGGAGGAISRPITVNGGSVTADKIGGGNGGSGGFGAVGSAGTGGSNGTSASPSGISGGAGGAGGAGGKGGDGGATSSIVINAGKVKTITLGGGNGGDGGNGGTGGSGGLGGSGYTGSSTAGNGGSGGGAGKGGAGGIGGGCAFLTVNNGNVTATFIGGGNAGASKSSTGGSGGNSGSTGYYGSNGTGVSAVGTVGSAGGSLGGFVLNKGTVTTTTMGGGNGGGGGNASGGGGGTSSNAAYSSSGGSGTGGAGGLGGDFTFVGIYGGTLSTTKIVSGNGAAGGAGSGGRGGNAQSSTSAGGNGGNGIGGRGGNAGTMYQITITGGMLFSTPAQNALTTVTTGTIGSGGVAIAGTGGSGYGSGANGLATAGSAGSAAPTYTPIITSGNIWTSFLAPGVAAPIVKNGAENGNDTVTLKTTIGNGIGKTVSYLATGSSKKYIYTAKASPYGTVYMWAPTVYTKILKAPLFQGPYDFVYDANGAVYQFSIPTDVEASITLEPLDNGENTPDNLIITQKSTALGADIKFTSSLVTTKYTFRLRASSSVDPDDVKTFTITPTPPLLDFALSGNPPNTEMIDSPLTTDVIADTIIPTADGWSFVSIKYLRYDLTDLTGVTTANFTTLYNAATEKGNMSETAPNLKYKTTATKNGKYWVELAAIDDQGLPHSVVKAYNVTNIELPANFYVTGKEVDAEGNLVKDWNGQDIVIYSYSVAGDHDVGDDIAIIGMNREPYFSYNPAHNGGLLLNRGNITIVSARQEAFFYYTRNMKLFTHVTTQAFEEVPTGSNNWQEISKSIYDPASSTELVEKGIRYWRLTPEIAGYQEFLPLHPATISALEPVSDSNNELRFYYQLVAPTAARTGDLTIEFAQDSAPTNVLHSQTINSVLEGSDQSITAPERVNGYTRVAPNPPQNIKITSGENKVTYFYEKDIKGDLTIKMLDIDTGVLIDQDVIFGLQQNETYTYNPHDLGGTGYRFVSSTPGTVNGKIIFNFKLGDELLLYYRLNTSTVTVRHLDEANLPITPEITENTNVGELYTATPVTVGDYFWIGGNNHILVSNNAADNIITLRYKKIEAGTDALEVCHIAKTSDGREWIIDTEFIGDVDDESYTYDPLGQIKPSQIEALGYTLITESQQTVNFTLGEHVVNIFYLPNQVDITVNYIDKETGTLLAPSKTYSALIGESILPSVPVLSGYLFNSFRHQGLLVTLTNTTIDLLYSQSTALSPTTETGSLFISYINDDTAAVFHQPAIFSLEAGKRYRYQPDSLAGYTLIASKPPTSADGLIVFDSNAGEQQIVLYYKPIRSSGGGTGNTSNPPSLGNVNGIDTILDDGKVPLDQLPGIGTNPTTGVNPSTGGVQLSLQGSKETAQAEPPPFPTGWVVSAIIIWLAATWIVVIRIKIKNR